MLDGWLSNSDEQVKTVILIKVSLPERTIHIEKWQYGNVENTQITRGRSKPTIYVPTKIHEIDIVDKKVIGDPLWISFRRVMLRKPNPKRKRETDFVFNKKELARIAADIWAAAKT
ncbi:hypothetical protein B9Z19DRAFT_1093588 [Tuber borchii]|uniref:Uncharacterized protein n=1 Tax=Tuber borchii TaxID=42251 RepID=A0A2T6ZF55_TUBBO|nr:hypothetical protein B9Z19DRAFT_1093588 [Tuber borchii]